MPIRLPCSRVNLSPRGLLHGYWGSPGLPRPILDLYVVGPGGRLEVERAQVDTAADYSLLGSPIAQRLGLSLPFPRQVVVSGAGGTQSSPASFPPDGLISLFVTDYREYAFLARPLVGFHAPGRGASAQRSVVGLTGFLQHFRFDLDLTAAAPVFELHPRPTFPGSVGTLPLDRPLADFIATLRGNS